MANAFPFSAGDKPAFMITGSELADPMGLKGVRLIVSNDVLPHGAGVTWSITRMSLLEFSFLAKAESVHIIDAPDWPTALEELARMWRRDPPGGKPAAGIATWQKELGA